MATFVRNFMKIITRIFVFVGIYILTLRFVHTWPLPMPADQQHMLFMLSRRLGIRDPDDLYIGGFALVDLIIAVVVYRAVMKLWRCYRQKRRDAIAS